MAAPQACRSIIWSMLADVVMRRCAKQHEGKSSLFFGEKVIFAHRRTTRSRSVSTAPQTTHTWHRDHRGAWLAFGA